MERADVRFYFDPDIKLRSKPLAEVWLEIRWKLKQSKENPNFLIDPDFRFALGVFSHSVRKRFGDVENLPGSLVPEEIAPYLVRHRFRQEAGTWPLLQIGPGVASVNFQQYDNWRTFEEVALYLQQELLNAYDGIELTTESVALRYRDIEPFSHSTNNFLEYIHTHLNTSVSLPNHIPGTVGRNDYPRHVDLNFTYDLKFPMGQGTIRISTGTKQHTSASPKLIEPEEVVIWQHEVISNDDDAPAISDSAQFEIWLQDAHAVIHEWFFSLIDGPLREKYEKE